MLWDEQVAGLALWLAGPQGPPQQVRRREREDDGRSRTEIRRWLNRAAEVTHGGATAQENDLIRATVDSSVGWCDTPLPCTFGELAIAVTKR